MLDKNKITRISVPHWPEVALLKLLPIVIKSKELRKHLQEYIDGGKMVDRDYFWHVLNAVKPTYVGILIRDAE